MHIVPTSYILQHAWHDFNIDVLDILDPPTQMLVAQHLHGLLWGLKTKERTGSFSYLKSIACNMDMVPVLDDQIFVRSIN